MGSKAEEGLAVRGQRGFFLLAATTPWLTTTVNGAAGRWISVHAPLLGWMADAVIPWLLISLLIGCVVDRGGLLRGPAAETDWKRVVRLSAIWLALWLGGSAAAALVAGHWIRYGFGTHNWAEGLGFVVIGPLAEELIFRGALFVLAGRAFPGQPKVAIIGTSVLFALFHLQFHHYKPDAAAGQMAFALPLGLVLATLRSSSQSIWPGWWLHVFTNLPGVFGS
jgi:membrane protease YdiL (CAAX protease family)